MTWADFLDKTLNRLTNIRTGIGVIILVLIIFAGGYIYMNFNKTDCGSCERERDDYKTALLQVSKMLAQPSKTTSFIQVDNLFYYAGMTDTIPKKKHLTKEEKIKVYVDSVLNANKPKEKKKTKGTKL